jgi:protein gp37
VPGHAYELGFEPRVVPHLLNEPLKWKKPKRIFVNSMSDLFHHVVPDDFIVSVARVMEQASWHVFQVLTKRADRLHSMLNDDLRFAADHSHIWWGVSVENKKHGLPHLRDTPARVKFLSIEPLLEDIGPINLDGISWVIVGGESGPGARPMKREWVKSIHEQCSVARVPFFFKQWGGVQKKRNGRELDGRTWDEFPTLAATAP